MPKPPQVPPAGQSECLYQPEQNSRFWPSAKSVPVIQYYQDREMSSKNNLEGDDNYGITTKFGFAF